MEQLILWMGLSVNIESVIIHVYGCRVSVKGSENLTAKILLNIKVFLMCYEVLVP